MQIRLSQGDFATAMQVLNENMNEGAPPAAAPAPASTSSADTAVTPVKSATTPG